MKDKTRDILNAEIREMALKPGTFKALTEELDRAAELGRLLEGRDEKVARLTEDNSNLDRRLGQAQRELEILRGNAERVRDPELQQARDNATAAAYKDCFQLMARNTEMRRQFFGDVMTPVAGPDGYAGFASKDQVSQTTTEEEV